MTKIMKYNYGDYTAQQANILTYNVTNDRGWNDPPTSVFSPNATGNRKRIDPRKARVGHNINASTGIYKPSNVLNGAFQSSGMNGLSQNMHNMSLQPQPDMLHHANSNPDLHNMSDGSIPSHIMSPLHHSASVPNKINAVGQYNGYMPNGLARISTPPPSICNTPPVGNSSSNQVCTTPPQNMTPPQSVTPPNRKFSAPSAIMDSNLITQLGTPTMLQSSHLTKPTPATSTDVSTNGFQVGGTYPMFHNNSSTGFKSIQNQESLYLQNQITTPQMSSLPPMPAVNNIANQNSLYARSVSSPGLPQRISPTNVGPPPTTGFYTSGSRGSPKNITPGNSGHNSPVPGLDTQSVENDSQLLKDTLKRLNDSREKCLCHLTNKINDDISKRIVSFEQSWTTGKLSSTVKMRMSQLSEALDKREFTQADSVHKSLILENSKEVMPWMVGIKKLISSYQQAVIENNKFQ